MDGTPLHVDVMMTGVELDGEHYCIFTGVISAAGMQQKKRSLTAISWNH